MSGEASTTSSVRGYEFNTFSSTNFPNIVECTCTHGGINNCREYLDVIRIPLGGWAKNVVDGLL